MLEKAPTISVVAFKFSFAKFYTAIIFLTYVNEVVRDCENIAVRE